MTTKQRGGKRPGAGRPQQYESLIRATITLLPEHAEYLKTLGNGKLSEGVRILTEQQIQG